MSHQYCTAIDRWAGLGPYFAMFPVAFANEVVRQYSSRGQVVLDPFAGRATGVFAAASQGRSGIGIEINEVGWLYGRVKLAPAPQQSVMARLEALSKYATHVRRVTASAMPEFFTRCYSLRVLRFLLAARKHLNWRTDPTDATLMALLLVYLHGKAGSALSNQMRQGKAMAPDYSISWWKEKGFDPPDIDPLKFLTKRIAWRFAKGAPSFPDSSVTLGDSMTEIASMSRRPGGVSLLFTSPPYFEVTNYHYDQWLRLWLLGGPTHPSKHGMGPWRGRFESRVEYVKLIETVFSNCKALLAENAVVYVRADARPFTRSVITQVLSRIFPEKQMLAVDQPNVGKTQTSQYGDLEPKPGEVDLILKPRLPECSYSES